MDELVAHSVQRGHTVLAFGDFPIVVDLEFTRSLDGAHGRHMEQGLQRFVRLV